MAFMTQLSYQPALDPFHAMYRHLRILSVIDAKALPVDHARILDFYLLFPFRVSGIRLKAQHRRFRGLAETYNEARPYGDQPPDVQIFARMKPMQIAALESLAAKDFIKAGALQDGTVVRSGRALPPALVERVSKANSKQQNLMQIIQALSSEYPLLGKDGLKDRTGLLEYRYDAV
jgi:hypothetical protein